ncbi:MAG: hypothetical protein ABSG86_18935 [Thermoguttaceae bacterium]|jgi:hypothetical protein
MSFDRARCREIHDILDQALRPVGERLGMIVRLGSARFTADNICFKLDVFENARTGSPEAADFPFYCIRYGLEPEDLGKTFTWGGKQYELIGCKPRSTRFPLLGRNLEGKVFKFPLDIVGMIRPGAKALVPGY